MPERVGEPSVFQHVIYIIKENRSYDQVLGDVTPGNGDPDLCVFGRRVTPNQHQFANDFVLLDNTYCCSILSADGHNWTDSGITTDYVEREFAGWPRSYPSGGGEDDRDALAYSPAGFIWNDALAHGRTVCDFGEFTSDKKQWKNPARKGKPGFLDCYRNFVDGTDEIALTDEPDIEALRPYIVNWDEVAGPMIARLHREISMRPGDEALRRLLARVLAVPGVPSEWRVPAPGRPAAPFLSVHLRAPALEVRLFTMLTSIGTALDVTAEEVHIETYFPADDASEAVLRAL